MISFKELPDRTRLFWYHWPNVPVTLEKQVGYSSSCHNGEEFAAHRLMTTASQPDQPLRIVAEIMSRHGARCTPEEFHAAVNVTFHNFESENYDQFHEDMWESLPEQFDLLTRDCLATESDTQKPLRLLDIGCGTGLATTCMLKTPLGSRVRSIQLLDTSPRMLQRAHDRVTATGIPFSEHLGLLDSLPATETYDVIVTCSVLHHVPDLAGFLRDVRARQASKGVFIHLQDPNGDYSADPVLRQRMEELRAAQQGLLPESLKRFAPGRILGRVYRELTGKQKQDPVSKTNQALLDSGLIQTPLTVAEVFDITDIHVEDGQGISISWMKTVMTDYDCVSERSYGFFGALSSSLPQKQQVLEKDLIAKKAQNGFHVGAAWRLRS